MSNTDTEPKASAPTHIAYHVKDGSNDKSYWTRIGAAWMHKDGKGFNIQLELLPPDCRITLRAIAEEE